MDEDGSKLSELPEDLRKDRDIVMADIINFIKKII